MARYPYPAQGGQPTAYHIGRMWNATKPLIYPPKYPMIYRKSKYVTNSTSTQTKRRLNGGGPSRGTNRVMRYKRGGGRYKRRRMRFGTKVRKQALGLFEGRVNNIPQTYLTGASVPPLQMLKVPLMDELENPATAVSSNGTAATQDTFSGRSIFVRGFKINMFFQNTNTSNPIDVRIICGWRKINAEESIVISDVGTTPEFAIFKNTITKQGGRKLDETANGDSISEITTDDVHLLSRAPIDNKMFHCEKDIVFRLGPSAIDQEQVFGANTKKISFWWELNNKKYSVKNTVNTSDADNKREQLSNWWPVVYMYHTTPLAIGRSGVNANYYMSHRVYWKDPLG